MYKHIMIPTDGSELCDKAIDAGIEFAREVHARVTSFTAVPEYRMPGEVELMSRHGVSLEQYEREARKLIRDLESALLAFEVNGPPGLREFAAEVEIYARFH